MAPIDAAAVLDGEALIGSHASGSGMPGIGLIAGTIADMVKAEVRKVSHSAGGPMAQVKKKVKTIAGDSEKAAHDDRAHPGPTDDKPDDEKLQFIRSSRTGVGHLVRCAEVRLHPSLWEAACGWRFGLKPHGPATREEVTCSRCRSALGAGESAGGMSTLGCGRAEVPANPPAAAL